ncbi:MAG TPA: DUF2177 family protein [Caulobacteraceae bacterium]|nr:DUF2177 family protein [Caulobacteraceae bacterium]
MNLRRIVVAYAGAALAFGALDGVWLSATGGALYRPALGPLLADQPRLAPAALFYLIYFAGLCGFAVAPALRSDRWTHAARRGAGLGLVAYATYDLTNQATLSTWPAWLTAVDLAWGAFASACGATAGFFAAREARTRAAQAG